MTLSSSVRRRTGWLGSAAVVMAAVLVLAWSARSVPAQGHAEQSESAASQESPTVAEAAEEKAAAKEAAAEESGAVEAPAYPRWITGVVLGPEGLPVSGAKVYLSAWESSHPVLSSSFYHFARPIDEHDEPWSRPTVQRTRTDARTDETGRYHASCEAWDPDAVVAYPSHESGYLAGRVRRESWPQGETRLVVDVALKRGKIVRGRVLDDETGKPIAGASVLYQPSKTDPLRKRSYLSWNPALTDGDGRFTLTVVGGPG